MELEDSMEGFLDLQICGLKYNYLKNLVYGVSVDGQRNEWEIKSNFILRTMHEKTLNQIYLHIYRKKLIICAYKENLFIISLKNCVKIFRSSVQDNCENSIYVEDDYLVFPGVNHELFLYNLLTQNIIQKIKGHKSDLKKTFIQSKTLFSLSNELIIFNLPSDFPIKLSKDKIIDFCVCNLTRFLVCTTGYLITLWDLTTKSQLISFSGCIISKILTNLDLSYLILSNYEVPMNNWFRIKRKFATLDIVNLQTNKLDLRLPYLLNTKFIIHKNSLMYATEKMTFTQWKLRSIPIIIDCAKITSSSQSESFLFLGTIQGEILVCNIESFDLINEKEIHTAEIFQIEYYENNIITGGFDEKIIITQFSELKTVAVIEIDEISRFIIRDGDLFTIDASAYIKVWSLCDGSIKNQYLIMGNASLRGVFNGMSFWEDKIIATSKKFGVLVHGYEDFDTFKDIRPSCIAKCEQNFAVGCWDGSIYYWNFNDMIIEQFDDNKDEIKSISFDLNGKYLLYNVFEIYRIFKIQTKTHVFRFEASYATFIKQLEGLRCCFCTSDDEVKIMEIKDEDMKNMSRKFALLMLFKRKSALL